MKITKNNKKLIETIDVSKTYEPIEAIKILKENKYAKFDETLEVAINLGIDSNKTDQGIRGVTSLPKGTGKSVNVAVLTKGEKQKEAKDAGADLVGDNDLIESISSGKISFDLLIASPDMMPSVGKVTMADIEKIAKDKMQDLNAVNLEGAVNMVKGSAVSMGMEVLK